MMRFLLLILLLAPAFADEIDECLALAARLNHLRTEKAELRTQFLQEYDALQERANDASANRTEAESIYESAADAARASKMRCEALRANITASRERLAALATVLDTREKQLLALEPSLPAPLADSLKDAFAAFRSPPTEPEHVPERLLRVLESISEISAFGEGVHTVQLMLTGTDGVLRLHDVLYLGLAQAFAVSPDGRSAGRGLPAPDGWHWHWDDSWGRTIRRALRAASGNAGDGMVPLPLTPEALQ